MNNNTDSAKNSKSIFVVDDSNVHNILLKKMLISCGYNVHTFTDGYSLLSILKDTRPHLIISDIDMPEIDGFELCKKIKSLPESRHIPVVYVSSLKREKFYGRAKETGAVGYIQKPITKQPFLEAIEEKLLDSGPKSISM